MLVPDSEFNIEVYSHFFTVQPVTARARLVHRGYLLTLVQQKLTKKQGRWTTEPDRTYAWKDSQRARYHLHINSYNDYIQYLQDQRYTMADISVKTIPLLEPARVELAVVDKYQPRGNQGTVIRNVLAAGKQAAITAQMGGGKTLMFMFIAAALGMRFSIRTKGGWAGRWETAFKEYLNLSEDEYIICAGAEKLYKYIRKYREGEYKGIKAVFISNGAIRSLLKDFGTPEQDHACGGPIHPWYLYEELGIGLVGIDEAHVEMHTHVMGDLHTHAHVRVSLTGTLESRDRFDQKIYELYLPKRLRFDLGAIDVYVNAFEVEYNLANKKPFERVIKASVYSHNDFEKVILKNQDMLKRYMDAWYKYIVRTWAATRIYDSKIIVFCGLVEMGGHITEYLKRRFPDLRVAQYLPGDDDDVLEDNDMLVATALKAGTAVDIARLTRVYNLISIDAPNTLLQILGRLRFLKDMQEEGFQFHQGVCKDIPKQADYQVKRKVLLAPRVLDINLETLELLL